MIAIVCDAAIFSMKAGIEIEAPTEDAINNSEKLPTSDFSTS